jgi:hypothetical protein
LFLQNSSIMEDGIGPVKFQLRERAGAGTCSATTPGSLVVFLLAIGFARERTLALGPREHPDPRSAAFARLEENPPSSEQITLQVVAADAESNAFLTAACTVGENVTVAAPPLVRGPARM